MLAGLLLGSQVVRIGRVFALPGPEIHELVTSQKMARDGKCHYLQTLVGNPLAK